MQDLNSNNLIQLADYVSGLVNRSVAKENDKNINKMMEIIKKNEVLLEIIPGL